MSDSPQEKDLVVSDAYRGVRERVCAVVNAADLARLDDIAPATPEWRVRDVVAHLVGVVSDISTGTLDGVATDPWTAAQVDARRNTSVAEMVDEWSQTSPGIEAQLDALPIEITGQMLFDAATHEHDVRQALSVPGARDSDAIRIAFDWMVARRVAGAAPAIEYNTGDAVAVAGVGDPIGRLSATRFEIVRAVSGRRTAAEIRALGFEADPELALGGPIFRVRDVSLGE